MEKREEKRKTEIKRWGKKTGIKGERVSLCSIWFEMYDKLQKT